MHFYELIDFINWKSEVRVVCIFSLVITNFLFLTLLSAAKVIIFERSCRNFDILHYVSLSV